MGQQEIYDFLKQNRAKWFSSKDISGILGTSIGSVTNSLRRLRESNFLTFRETEERRNTFLYKFKK